MLEKFKYNKFIKEMNLLITDSKFLDKLHQIIFNIETQCSNCKTNYNKSRFAQYMIWAGSINNKDYDLSIVMDKNSIKFAYCTDNNNNNQFGEFYRTNKHTISKYFYVKITSHDEFRSLEQTKEISIFMNNIEIFKYQESNHNNYKIVNGVKTFLPNDKLTFGNFLQTRKIRRTKENRLIIIEENKYYDHNKKKNNIINYYIDNNSSVNEQYIESSGEPVSISEEKYSDYSKGIITEDELLRNFTYRK